MYKPRNRITGSCVDHVAVEPIKAIDQFITSDNPSQKAHISGLAMACNHTIHIVKLVHVSYHTREYKHLCTS